MEKSNVKTQAIKISIISIIVNILLSVLKLIAGYAGHSQALIADAVHSASDVFTTVIVIVSLFISAKSADSKHQYGHQKFESLATLALGILLADVGVKIGASGIKAIVKGTYIDAITPTMITVVAAAVSIASKEIMFWFTIRVAKKEKSNALKADAWHHRSDALSSVGSLIGVLFSMFGFPIMDSIAGIVISIFIIKTAVEIVVEAVKALTDSACDEKTEEDIKNAALSIPGVMSVDMLKTRIFGSGFYVDMEIIVDKNLVLVQSHEIAEKVHDKIEEEFKDALHVMVHVNPCE